MGENPLGEERGGFPKIVSIVFLGTCLHAYGTCGPNPPTHPHIHSGMGLSAVGLCVCASRPVAARTYAPRPAASTAICPCAHLAAARVRPQPPGARWTWVFSWHPRRVDGRPRQPETLTHLVRALRQPLSLVQCPCGFVAESKHRFGLAVALEPTTSSSLSPLSCLPILYNPSAVRAPSSTLTHHLAMPDTASLWVPQRIIRMGGAVDDDMANLIVAQLLYLDSDDADKVSRRTRFSLSAQPIPATIEQKPPTTV